MKNLKNIYQDEIKLLQLLQSSFFYGVKFEKENYEVKDNNSFMQKKLYKKLKDGIEINCKEKIYKKWIEKYLEIKVEKNKKEYEIYKIIIDMERIKLICEKYIGNKKMLLSKQFGLKGHIIYTYNDNDNNYILHQNVNNLFQYLEDFNEKIYCDIFKLDGDNIKYIAKFPYKFAYESIVNCNAINEVELNTLFKEENKKRKSTNSTELKLKKENNKNIDIYDSKMKLVYDNTNKLYNYIVDTFLKFPQIDEIMQKGTQILEELNSVEKNVNESEVENKVSELEILRSQKLEFIEMKKTTDEIISKLQNILIN